MIRQYTTPTLTVEVGADLTGCKAIVSIMCEGERKDYEYTEFDVKDGVTTIKVQLSQEDTAKYTTVQTILMQCNWIASDGVRMASEQKRIAVAPNLLKEIITYGD